MSTKSNPKVVIFGNGFIGNRLHAEIPGSVLYPRTDIADEDDVRLWLDDADIVINAAGKTGRPNVDWCETHQAETFRSNVIGALTLAKVAASTGAYLLHIGSGCIFYGRGPRYGGTWAEDDPANPVSFYSRTKYAADLVLSKMPNVGIVRIRMPIDGKPGDRNLITKLAGYSRVADVVNSVTVMDDFAHVVRGLILHRGTGVFHATNPGVMAHRDLIALYQKLVDPTHRCEFVEAGDLVVQNLVAAPRSNCVLVDSKLEDFGIQMRPVDVALRDAMEKYAEAVEEEACDRDSYPPADDDDAEPRLTRLDE